MFYNKNGILVDQSRYNVEGETFPINTIASVSAQKITNPKLIIPGLLFTLVGLINIAFNPGIGFLALVAGAVFLYFAFAAKYAVRITNAAGNADSYMSKNREEILEIVDAINEAIVNRG